MSGDEGEIDMEEELNTALAELQAEIDRNKELEDRVDELGANTICGDYAAGGTRLTGADRTTAGTCNACAAGTFGASDAATCQFCAVGTEFSTNMCFNVSDADTVATEVVTETSVRFQLYGTDDDVETVASDSDAFSGDDFAFAVELQNN